MAQVYFHYTSDHGVAVDTCGADANDLIEARDHAAQLVRSLVAAPSLEDWRHWVLHVSDELGEEIFVMPLASMLGRPH